MQVLITGATGYIGQAVAEKLMEAGHQVTALARSSESASRLQERGYTVARGDLSEADRLAELARGTDAVIHVANTGGPDTAEVDRGAAEAFLDALEGTGKPFIYTSGVWVLGDTGETPAGEDAPVDPTPLAGWRESLEPEIVAASDRGVRTAVIRPGIVYGRGGGIPGMIASGDLPVVGDGLQEWPVVHVEDLADLYVRALAAPAGSVYHAADGPSYRMRDLAVASRGTAFEAWPLDRARQELGDFALALALDQRLSARKAREELDWRPGGPTIIEELVAGSYAGS